MTADRCGQSRTCPVLSDAPKTDGHGHPPIRVSGVRSEASRVRAASKQVNDW